jgi:hypothetical protein
MKNKGRRKMKQTLPYPECVVTAAVSISKNRRVQGTKGIIYENPSFQKEQI